MKKDIQKRGGRSELPTPICSTEDAARKRGRLKAVRDELWTATECLSRAASDLQEMGDFTATLTEIKTTIGDLSVSQKMIEDFLSQNVELSCEAEQARKGNE